MRSYDLIELSALIAVNGRTFLEGRGRLSDNSVTHYWSASRCRFDRWAHALRMDSDRLSSQAEKAPAVWQHARPILEEILTGEVLTRVWTAVACQHDRQRGSSYVSPVVRSVFLGHMEARNRALNFMFRAQECDPDTVLDINRVRHRSERWTDMLLSYLTPVCDITQAAFDRKRVADFAEDVFDQFRQPNREQAWQLLSVALRNAFGNCLAARAPNGDLNAQIAISILANLRPEAFEATGSLDSLWMERLEYTTADAAELIEELLTADGPQAVPRATIVRRPRRPVR